MLTIACQCVIVYRVNPEFEQTYAYDFRLLKTNYWQVLLLPLLGCILLRRVICRHKKMLSQSSARPLQTNLACHLMVGGSFVANAPPDGYTLLLGNIAGPVPPTTTCCLSAA